MKTPSGKRKVLIVRLDAIGDYVLFRNVLRFIRRSERYRDTEITILGNPSWRSLAEASDSDCADEWIWAKDRNGLFRKGFENLLPKVFWRRRVACAQGRLRDQIKAMRFDEVLSLQPTRDPLLDEFVAGLAPEVVGVAEPGLDSSMYTRLLDKGPDAFVFLQNRTIASALADEPCGTALSLQVRPPTVRANEVVVYAGASHWTKRWPRKRVREFVHKVLGCSQLCVAIASGPGEKWLSPFAESFLDARVQAIPPMPLPEFALRLAGARAVVTNDTMALHLAAALGVPAVVVTNGISGRGGFWPYPESLGKRVDVVVPSARFTSRHCGFPLSGSLGLALRQIAKARAIASIPAEHVFRCLQRHLTSTHDM